jgi:hypothetical protein
LIEGLSQVMSVKQDSLQVPEELYIERIKGKEEKILGWVFL